MTTCDATPRAAPRRPAPMSNARPPVPVTEEP